MKSKAIKLSYLAFCIVLFVCISCTENTEETIYKNYAGSWKCMETSSLSGLTKPYIVYIDKSETDTANYIIRNFFDAGNNQMIVIKTTKTSAELMLQPTSGHILRSFSGSASAYSQIKLQYTIYDGERDVYYEANYTRK